MTENELKALWKAQPLDAGTVSIDTIRSLAAGFHATIVRRNRQEAGAACLVMLFFGLFACFEESTTLRIASVLLILGTLVMLYQLRKRAAISAVPADAMARSHVDYLRAALMQQRDALRSIWQWSIAPTVPGIALLLWGMAEADPSGFPWLPMLALFAVPFGVVVWMNLRNARQLQQKIDELEAVSN